MSYSTAINRRFPLGRVVMTANAARRLGAFLSVTEVMQALRRHASGDWGEVDPEDATLNDEALTSGGRLLSAYHASDGTKFWIITEADRSVTTVLLPDDY